MAGFLESVADTEGLIAPRALAQQFHITVKEMADLSGLTANTVSKQQRYSGKVAQRRLREIMVIMNRITPWCGSTIKAYAWYRSEQLPTFGGMTAEDLVKQDKAQVVMDYLSRITIGGYA